MKRLVKKIAGTTLVLTMGVSGTALAADIDLTGMSLDELVELQNNIVAEIDSRTNDGKDVIPCGVYVVGTDIKEGSFKLSTDEDNYTDVLVFEDEDTYKTYAADHKAVNPLFSAFVGLSGSTTVNLKTGEVLYIYSGEMIIEESNASWMPDGN